MPDQEYNEDYLLECDEKPLRLERQALIYGFEDDLRHLSLSSNERELDAGCGAGSITRAIAKDNASILRVGNHEGGSTGNDNVIRIGDVVYWNYATLIGFRKFPAFAILHVLIFASYIIGNLIVILFSYVFSKSEPPCSMQIPETP